MPVLPGPPTTAAGRGLGHPSPLEAPPGSIPQRRPKKMSDLYAETLERQAAIARERAAQEKQQLEDVKKRNIEYLERLENGDSQ
jgi:hypothetical protein